jgi:D-alanyl-D-alanine carboxypeptidase/D-alanyl-D-alanine-endopeptidase (penicillin-binding protein 4)
MLRESDNQTAELLLKELAVATGHPGTTAAGAAVVADALAELGLPVERSVVTDGSGLSEDDRQTCELFQAILDRPVDGFDLAAALPVAGESGTLARRYLDTPVQGRMQAKTGTLNQVTARAGFVDTLPGSRISFTYVANLPPDDRVDEADLRFQDALATALLGYPEGPPLDQLGPLGPAPPGG